MNDNAGVTEIGVQKYEPLLVQIVSGLGFGARESNEMLAEIYQQAGRKYEDYSGLVPFRVWLAKILVRKCIFKLSADIFSGQGNFLTRSAAAGNYYGRNIFGEETGQMPLSFWIVYVLQNKICFNEKEIAEILNTSQVLVRERFNKAMQFLEGRGRSN